MTLFEKNMDIGKWKRSTIIKKLPGIIKGNDEFYETIIDATGAGPMDGGCYVMARTLQMLFNGEIYVLTRPSGKADHAVLKLPDGRFVDADGIASSGQEMINRFNELESADTISARPITPEDLPESPRDDITSRKLMEIILKSI